MRRKVWETIVGMMDSRKPPPWPSHFNGALVTSMLVSISGHALANGEKLAATAVERTQHSAPRPNDDRT
jgi:hypothetical protein